MGGLRGGDRGVNVISFTTPDTLNMCFIAKSKAAMEDDDDWLLSSMQRYDQLFMYDVSFPIQKFDWTIDHCGLWVFGTHDNEQREINLLHLPEKILSKPQTGRRDFRIVSGSLTPLNLSCIKTISPKMVATGTVRTGLVHFWTQDQSSEDLLIQQSQLVIPCTLPSINQDVTNIEMPQNNSEEFLTIQGEIGVLSLFSLTSSGQMKWQNKLSNVIHGTSFMDNCTILACHGNDGSLLNIDLRQPMVKPSTSMVDSSLPSHRYCLSTSQNSVITLSTTNQLKLYDTRNLLDTPVAMVNLSSKCDSLEPPNVKYGIVDSSKISVSGCNESKVDVYDTKSWNGIINDPPAVFTHDGHEEETGNESVTILSHDWHHLTDRMIISTASNGSLHAWQYNHK